MPSLLRYHNVASAPGPSSGSASVSACWWFSGSGNTKKRCSAVLEPTCLCSAAQVVIRGVLNVFMSQPRVGRRSSTDWRQQRQEERVSAERVTALLTPTSTSTLWLTAHSFHFLISHLFSKYTWICISVCLSHVKHIRSSTSASTRCFGTLSRCV